MTSPAPERASWPHAPGAGLIRVREVLGDQVPEITEDDERQADDLLARAQQDAARIYGRTVSKKSSAA